MAYSNRPNYGGKAKLPVYEVNEDDEGDEWAEESAEGEGDEQAWEGEDGDWEEEEEDAVEVAEPSKWERVKTHKPKKEKVVVRLVSDVDDAVYFDELALVRCWDSALDDYKVLNPSLFSSPCDAPRSTLQKQQHAPLWYGQPSSEAESSTAPLKRLAERANPYTVNSKRVRYEEDSAKSDVDLIEEPNYRPMSPTHQRELSPGANGSRARSASNASSETPDFIPSTITLPAQAGPHLPSSQLAQALPAAPAGSRIPTDFPPPPPIVPLTGDEETLPREAPEELLKQALWAWYAAGYQTGLYHAAVGVAGANAVEVAGASGVNGAGQEEMQLSE